MKTRQFNKGATLAEFTLFLPVWVTMIFGLVNLGQGGVQSTAVQMTAAKSLWSQSINVTESSVIGLNGLPHAVPSGSAIHKSVNLGAISFKSGNKQKRVDRLEAAAHATGLATGHWGDAHSAIRTRHVPTIATLATVNGIEVTHKASDVLGEQSERVVPHILLNDGLERELDPDVGAVRMISELASVSGLVTAVGAGMRYGDVYASSEREIALIGGVEGYTARAHYDALAGPTAVSQIQFKTVSTGLVWLATQSDEDYRVMPRYGKSDF